MMRSAPTRLALGVAIAVLAGCGGDDDENTAGSPPAKSTTAVQETTSRPANTTTGGDEGPQERGQVGDPRGAVVAVLTSSDPAEACGRYVTSHYLRVAYGGRQGCIQAQAPGSAADRLEFKNLRTEGNQATAVVVPSGGPYDGDRVTVALIRDGSRWAVDDLDANVPVGP